MNFHYKLHMQQLVHVCFRIIFVFAWIEYIQLISQIVTSFIGSNPHKTANAFLKASQLCILLTFVICQNGRYDVKIIWNW